jgi:hypothetical protein
VRHSKLRASEVVGLLARSGHVHPHSRRRCCARLSGKRILCGMYCPKDNSSPGEKSDAILSEKRPCQQLNEGEQ